MNQATEAPTPEQQAAAVDCVGSEERLLEIAEALASYFASLPID